MASVTLYDEISFEGISLSVNQGGVRLLAGDFKDRTMSVRVPDGYCALLYENANEYGGYGASVDLLEDCEDLTGYGLDRKTSFVHVFKTEKEESNFVRGRMENGEYIRGHWERVRAGGAPRLHGGHEPVVGPPLPAPTTPVVYTDDEPEIRDHRRPGEIKHVFVLMLENRSFDHLLGFSGIKGTDIETQLPTAIDGVNGSESNSYNGITYKVSLGAPDVAPHGPEHNFHGVLEQLCGDGAAYASGVPYPSVDNSGFVSNYARLYPDLPDGALKCFAPDQVPVITALAAEFVVCDKWFCSMPGPTEPNRWFVHAATAGALDGSPKDSETVLNELWGGVHFDKGSIFGLLKKHGVRYRIYSDDAFPNVAELDDVSVYHDIREFDDFSVDVASPNYNAAYTFLEPYYDTFGHFKGGNSQHPLGSIKAGEMLIKKTYEAIRSSPLWESSMLIVTYDEHGGFYDHVAPPSAVATGSTGRSYGFSFEQLGPRVPTIVISPHIPRNSIDHRQYEHSSIISTLIELFDLDPLTSRSSASSGLKRMVTLRTAREDAPTTLPDAMGGTTARTGKPKISEVTADQPEAPLSDDPEGNIGAMLRSGVKQHLEVTPPAQHEAIIARVNALRTHGEALQYLKEVASLVQSVKAQPRFAPVRFPTRVA